MSASFHIAIAAWGTEPERRPDPFYQRALRELGQLRILERLRRREGDTQAVAAIRRRRARLVARIRGDA